MDFMMAVLVMYITFDTGIPLIGIIFIVGLLLENLRKQSEVK
jgi:hypothetical protein